MVYSSRKPYQRGDLSQRDFFSRSTRHLKDSVGPESLYEKPYVDEEYGDMNQAPNLPTVRPPVPGSGGLVCLFSNTECDIVAECFAGPEVQISGGPEEARAGYLEPEVIKGGIIKWDILEQRKIRIILNPNVSQNIISVKFKDGWGNIYQDLIDSTCAVVGWTAYPSYDYIAEPDSRLGYFVFEDEDDFPDIGLPVLSYQRSHILFTNVTIPAGATITSATFSAWSNRNSSSPSQDLDIELNFQRDVTPSTFPGGQMIAFAAAFEAKTAAGTIWEVNSNWTTNTKYTSPDISAPLQELIDMAGWASGNDAGLLLGFSLAPAQIEPVIGTSVRRSFRSNTLIYLPELAVTWTGPVGSGTFSPHPPAWPLYTDDATVLNNYYNYWT